MDREKHQSLRSIARVLVVWISEAVGLVLMTHFVPGLRVDTWETGILVVGVIALLNADPVADLVEDCIALSFLHVWNRRFNPEWSDRLAVKPGRSRISC